jgi:asparagine synthase (glutamine-hydrolysing)
MCGLCGFVDFNKKITRKHLTSACNSLKHRGPDDTGMAFFEMQVASVGLGHCRLSVLDLTSLGHQPMYNSDQSVSIILNGEIYNFKEVRRELLQKGHSFVSNSDTEVVLKAYEEFGIDCLQRFIGMFAIVICDTNLQKVFLVRDRAGVKPLYYYFADGCLLFASELKAFHRFPNFKKEINEEAIALYFKYGYIKAPYCIFKNANKVLPGFIVTLNLKSQLLQQVQYWNLLDYYNKPTIEIDEVEAVAELEKLCNSAFEYHTMSDVPVGVFLSGGYDSSLLAAVLQKKSSNKIETFTIGFANEAFNEAGHAKKVAQYLGTSHNEYTCTEKDAQEIIPALPYFFDEPFGDSSAIPTILLSRFAKQKITVALSADGGDEIFAGYNRYDQLMLIDKAQQKIPGFIKSSGAKLLHSIPGLSHKFRIVAALLTEKKLLATADLLSTHFLEKELKKILQNNLVRGVCLNEINSIDNLGFINTLLAADFKTYLPDDILTKVDRATMSAGLEAREPLLDHRIVEWAAQLPAGLKYSKRGKKYLIKQLTHKYVPVELMDRSKMGFAIPFGKWLKGTLRPLLHEAVNEKTLSSQNILDKEFVLQLLDKFLTGKTKNDSQIWLIFMFMLWWNEWMQKKVPEYATQRLFLTDGCEHLFTGLQD